MTFTATAPSRVLKSFLLCFCVSVSASALFTTGTAHAWDPFKRQNSNVKEGNEHLLAKDPARALALYDHAARQLPSEAGVHLDRGLALMASGQTDAAREAFLMAARPAKDAHEEADDEQATRQATHIQAAAYYNMGLAFYQQGDAAAQEEDHQNAQTMFREAVDALRRSLRTKPGNRDAAWNLELAVRRLREQEEEQRKKEEEQEQQEQEQEEQEQQEKEKDNEEQGPQQDQDQEQEQQQDQEQQQQDQEQDQQQQDQQQEQDQQQSQQQEQDQQQSQQQEQDQQQPQQALPRDAERILDALQDSEESLERVRARARSARENRRPTKDW